MYLKAYDSVGAARIDIADYPDWYTAHRSHSSLERLTPNEKYLASPPPMAQAALDEILGAPRVVHRVVGSSQAPTAAVDNFAPFPTRPESTYKSGITSQTSGATSVFLALIHLK
ncbi:MAG: hypothetical protein ACREXT_10030 [Gammaproteobacteria bacterium]